MNRLKLPQSQAILFLKLDLSGKEIASIAVETFFAQFGIKFGKFDLSGKEVASIAGDVLAGKFWINRLKSPQSPARLFLQFGIKFGLVDFFLLLSGNYIFLGKSPISRPNYQAQNLIK
jgi:hypothetical protein